VVSVDADNMISSSAPRKPEAEWQMPGGLSGTAKP
jgi:hypothetical protein